MGKKVFCYATVTNTADGIVGSFGTFNDLLKKNGFAGKRIRVTYEICPEGFVPEEVEGEEP